MTPTVLIRRLWTARDRVKGLFARPHTPGRTAGTEVLDRAALKKAVVLCEACYWKFDYRRHGYYPIWRFEGTPVRGACDGCQEDGGNRHLYLHETSVDRTWLRKDVARQRGPAVLVGPGGTARRVP